MNLCVTTGPCKWTERSSSSMVQFQLTIPTLSEELEPFIVTVVPSRMDRSSPETATGDSISRTVMCNSSEPEYPAASVTVKVTSYSPAVSNRYDGVGPERTTGVPLYSNVHS